MPEISAILPAYNVGMFINECLESIMRQTFKDFEVIVIDDGSSDDTYDNVVPWTRMYGNMKVIRQDNKGAGAARNCGLVAAKGNYVIFIDPDDTCDEHMFEKMYEAVKENDSDIAVCDYYEIKKDKLNIQKKRVNLDITPNIKLTIVENKKSLFKVNPQPWNKLIKRELLINNNILFPTKYRREDLYVIYSSLLKASGITRVNEPLYNYTVLREGSATKSYSTLTDVTYNLEYLIDFFKKEKKYDKFYDELEMINAICGLGWYLKSLSTCETHNLNKIIKHYSGFFKKHFPLIYKNKYIKTEWNLKRRFLTRILLTSLGPFILFYIFKFRHKLNQR